MVTGPKQILHKGFDAFEFVCCGMKTWTQLKGVGVSSKADNSRVRRERKCARPTVFEFSSNCLTHLCLTSELAVQLPSGRAGRSETRCFQGRGVEGRYARWLSKLRPPERLGNIISGKRWSELTHREQGHWTLISLCSSREGWARAWLTQPADISLGLWKDRSQIHISRWWTVA